MSIVTKLTNQDDIIQWREAKTQADRDKHYRTKLGCVGEPLSDALDKVLRYIPCLDDREDCLAILDAAAAEARGNLLDYANEQRRDGADAVLADVECLVQFDAYDLEIDASDTLAEIAEQGFDLALRTITAQCWNVTDITDEEL